MLSGVGLTRTVSYPGGDVVDREELGRVHREKRPDASRVQVVGGFSDGCQGLAVGWAMSEGSHPAAMTLDRDLAPSGGAGESRPVRWYAGRCTEWRRRVTSGQPARRRLRNIRIISW